MKYEVVGTVRLHEVIALAESLGVFQAEPKAWEHANHFRRVITPEGLGFMVSHHDGKIIATVAEMGDLRRTSPTVQPSEVIDHDAKSPEATASISRSAESILADLRRRVFDNPEARAVAIKVRETLAQRLRNREALIDNIAALQAQGWRMDHRELNDREFWECKMWGPNGLVARVCADGKCYVERLTVHISNVSEVARISNGMPRTEGVHTA